MLLPVFIGRELGSGEPKTPNPCLPAIKAPMKYLVLVSNITNLYNNNDNPV